MACRGIGRTIIPGRVELMDVDVPVGCGGVLVRPGDIVGCDWDGVMVVPLEVAEDVLCIAARIAVDDKKARRRLYDKPGDARRDGGLGSGGGVFQRPVVTRPEWGQHPISSTVCGLILSAATGNSKTLARHFASTRGKWIVAGGSTCT